MHLRFVRRYADIAQMSLILQQQWVSVGRYDEERRTEWRDVSVVDTHVPVEDTP